MNLWKKKINLKTGITFFVTDNMSGLEMLSAIKSGLASLKENEKEFDLGSLKITMKNIKEEDWANNGRNILSLCPVGDKIMIKPSWENLAEPTDKIVLKIDPRPYFRHRHTRNNTVLHRAY